MSQILRPYKGYIARIEIDVDAQLLHGRVIGLKDVISFSGLTVEEATRSFHNAIDSYLAFCNQMKVSPEKTFSGKISFRPDPETHRLIALAAQLEGKSVNAWMTEVLEEAAQETLEEATRDEIVANPARETPAHRKDPSTRRHRSSSLTHVAAY